MLKTFIVGNLCVTTTDFTRALSSISLRYTIWHLSSKSALHQNVPQSSSYTFQHFVSSSAMLKIKKCATVSMQVFSNSLALYTSTIEFSSASIGYLCTEYTKRPPVCRLINQNLRIAPWGRARLQKRVQGVSQFKANHLGLLWLHNFII